MTEFQSEKNQLRLASLARRNALDGPMRDEAARNMLRASAQINFPRDTLIAGFWPIRSEPDVHPLMASLAARGARLCLPVTLDATTMIFREYSADAELIASGFGTMGPGPDAEVVDPQILLVPLAVFDSAGNRIGYGAGFYDRAIAALHRKDMRPELIGVAFDCQEVPVIQAEPHDIPLHAVLTESGLRRVDHAW